MLADPQITVVYLKRRRLPWATALAICSVGSLRIKAVAHLPWLRLLLRTSNSRLNTLCNSRLPAHKDHPNPSRVHLEVISRILG